MAKFEFATRGVKLTDLQEAAVRKLVRRLEATYPRMIACRMMIDVPHRRSRSGKHCKVRIAVTVPGDEFVIARDRRTEVLSVVQEAFDAARRQLQERSRDQRPRVRTRQEATRARVARLFPEAGYGFLETTSGEEIYFNANAVTNDAYDQLRVGAKVRYVEVVGDEGPQASTVTIEGRKPKQPQVVSP